MNSRPGEFAGRRQNAVPAADAARPLTAKKHLLFSIV
jgi:hypothetical protein